MKHSRVKLKGRFRRSIERVFTKGRSNRSIGGTIGILLFIGIFAVFSIFPVAFMVGNAFKQLSELFRYPPTLFAKNPTLNNFYDLWEYASSSLVPFSRYLFNTGSIVLLGSVGHIVVASMAAFPLAKYKFRGNKFLSSMIVYSLMFSGAVTAVPNYIVMSYLGLVDSVWSVVLPALSSTLGLYLLKNFMVLIPDAMIEAGEIDGASPFTILWKIVMPLVKPAWVTVFIFSFQGLWGNTGGNFIYSENLKPLSYMLAQIASVGISRLGVAAAASLLMFVIPLIVFVISQSNILETMSTSGLKE